MISDRYYKINHSLDNYFMKPYFLSGLGLIYPIKLYDYDDFSILAKEIILLDIPKRNNLERQQFEKAKMEGKIERKAKFQSIKQEHLFDWIINLIEISSKKESIYLELQDKFENITDEELQIILENNPNGKDLLVSALSYNGISICSCVCKLISMTVNNEVYYDYENKIFNVIENDEIIGMLNRDNFYEYRKVVMEQNVLHEPRIGGNLQSQIYIDRELKLLYGDNEFSIESMIAFVSCGSNIDISDYTYYRVRADYIMETRKLDYVTTNNYNANGCKTKNGGNIPIPIICEPLGLNINPYNKNSKEVSEEEINKTIMKK